MHRYGGEEEKAALDADGILLTCVEVFCIRRNTLAVSRCLQFRRDACMCMCRERGRKRESLSLDLQGYVCSLLRLKKISKINAK